MAASSWAPLREAWEQALYGPSGFYRRELPRDHFRTSVHASPLFADAVVRLARRSGSTTVYDVGAGAGELLRAMRARAPDLALTGVDIRARPAGLPNDVGWSANLPTGARGLVFCNELLDNRACDVVELDEAGVLRVVEVEAGTGEQRLGAPASGDLADWVRRWWPLERPGDRAEVGTTRETLWRRLVADNPAALCVAVDFGHLREDRPERGTLASYRRGRARPAAFDGRHDVTAAVAFDALQATCGGLVRRQAAVLLDLGVSPARPPLDLATTDPGDYVSALARAGEADELTSPDGLGGFFWLFTREPAV